MAGRKVTINRAGVAAVAKSGEMQSVISSLADEVAGNVRSQNIRVGDRDGGPHEDDLPVDVSNTVTDRARSVVRLNHPAGIAVQAKHGALTRAAIAAGLQVKEG